ncbi:MAG: hypothetical protein K5907_04040 [Treponema sp.]|nr:hypothetical protein [Treponema sp.]
MDTRTLNSKRNIIVGVLGHCLIPIFGLIVNSSIVRHFSVEYIGLIGTFNAVLQILNLAELGFSTSMIVNLYKPLKDNDTVTVRGILATYRRVYRIIGLVILAAGIVVCFFLNSIVKDAGGISENIYILYLLYLANRVVTFILFAHKEALLNAAQRLDIINLVHITTFVGKSCLQLAAIIIFKNIYFFAIALLVSTILYYIILNIISKKKFSQYYPEGKIDTSIKENVKKQVAGLTISNILGVSRDSLNSLLITSFFGLYIAGQYSNYCTIYDAVIGFFLVTTKAIQSSIGNSIVSESVEKNYINLTKMEFLHNIVTTACTVYMLCLYQPFMKIWMGEKLMFSNPLMMLFVLYFYIRAMSEVRNAYFSALGYWWKAKWLFIIEAVVVIGLMVCLGKTIGVAGIILAPSISIVTVNYIGITNLLFQEYFGKGRKVFYINRIIYTLITIIICVAAYYCSNLIPYEGIPGLIVRLLVCTLVLLIMVPTLMFLVKRSYLKEAVVFIKQIFKA